MKRKLRENFKVTVKHKEVSQEEYDFAIWKCIELLLDKVLKNIDSIYGKINYEFDFTVP